MLFAGWEAAGWGRCDIMPFENLFKFDILQIPGPFLTVYSNSGRPERMWVGRGGGFAVLEDPGEANIHPAR